MDSLVRWYGVGGMETLVMFDCFGVEKVDMKYVERLTEEIFGAGVRSFGGRCSNESYMGGSGYYVTVGFAVDEKVFEEKYVLSGRIEELLARLADGFGGAKLGGRVRDAWSKLDGRITDVERATGDRRKGDGPEFFRPVALEDALRESNSRVLYCLSKVAGCSWGEELELGQRMALSGKSFVRHLGYAEEDTVARIKWTSDLFWWHM